MKDFYSILGIDENATPQDIKKAFREKSKQFHPDVNPNGEDAFKEINEANEVLSNPQKRSEYDSARKFGGNINLADLFREFKNSFGGFSRRQEENYDLDIHLTQRVGVVDVMKEREISFLVDRNLYCGECNGEGGEMSVCEVCKGSGTKEEVIRNSLMTQIFQTSCQNCNGRGKVKKSNCKKCDGKGFKIENFKFKVKLKNIKEDQFHIFRGQGNQYKGKTGNILLRFIIEPQSGFTKEKDNLNCTVFLTLDNLKEENFIVKHPMGDIMVPFPINFSTAEKIEIPKKGFNSKGSLFIKCEVIQKRNG